MIKNNGIIPPKRRLKLLKSDLAGCYHNINVLIPLTFYGMTGPDAWIKRNRVMLEEENDLIRIKSLITEAEKQIKDGKL